MLHHSQPRAGMKHSPFRALRRMQIQSQGAAGSTEHSFRTADDQEGGGVEGGG